MANEQKNEDNKKEEEAFNLEIEKQMDDKRSKGIDKLAKIGTDVGMPEIKAEEIAMHTWEIYLQDIETKMMIHKLKFGDEEDNQNWMRLKQELTDKQKEATECMQVFIAEWQNEEED